MAYTPPTYTPPGSLFGTTTPSTPYTYGNLGLNSSAYNIWGSTGNPYLQAGPTYTPGSGAPINPVPIAPVAPVNNGGGGGSDYVDNTYTAPSYNLSDGTEVDFDPLDPNSFRSQQTSVLNPYGWNWGKIGGGLFGGIGGAYLGGQAYNDYMTNTPEQAALVPVEEKSTGYGMDNGWTTNNWQQEEANAIKSFGALTPMTFGDPNSKEAVDSRNKMAAEKQRVTTNIAKKDALAVAAQKAEQAKAVAASRADADRYAGYTAQIDSLTAQLAGVQSVNSQQYDTLLSQLETVEGDLSQQIADTDAANSAYYNSNPYNFAPNDIVTGDTGSWTNPAAGVDTSTLGGSLGTGSGTSYSSGNSRDGYNGSVTVDTDTGSTSYDTNDMGGGYHSVDVGDDEDVGYEDPNGGDSGGSSNDSGCFIEGTMVTDASGKDKAINEFKIGDKVMSADGNSINKVTFIEKLSWDDDYVLYSPDTKHKPFITQNHPIIVDGEWVSADIGYTTNNQPWIDAKEIDSKVVKKGKGITVYNLWLDGDNTYTVNGYGTETLLGDGGIARQALEFGNMDMDDFMTIVNSSKEATAETTYGMHLLNKWLSVINNKAYNKFIIDSVLGKRKGTLVKSMISLVGNIAVTLTPRLWNKSKDSTKALKAYKIIRL